jgi:ankyrin repeat protein
MMARLLLAKSTCLIDAVTNDKRTPLHIAAQFKQSSIARLLILRRANLNLHSDDAGATPLHTSAKYGAIEVARALVAARPDFDARDNFKLTALMRAVVESQDEMVEFLAAYCNVNAKEGATGWRALHWAAKEDNPRACRILLAKGASKFIKNEQGLTPHQVAFKLQKLKVMGLL